MGRNKKFNTQDVVTNMSMIFIKYGYEGTSLDDLVKATGLLRGSLYSEFGSKRGMFVAALMKNIEDDKESEITLNLAIIAMMELTTRDNEVKQIICNWENQLNLANLPNLIGSAILKNSQTLGDARDGK